MKVCLCRCESTVSYLKGVATAKFDECLLLFNGNVIERGVRELMTPHRDNG